MSLPTTVAEIIDRHVTFTLESIDRMYLNVYQPMLQRGGGVSVFFRQHRQEACATALVMSRMTETFVSAVEQFADKHQIPLVSFERGIRKEDVFHEHLQRFESADGVVMIGKSQEKATVYRTTKRRSSEPAAPTPG